VSSQGKSFKLLDYGCGSGAFIGAIQGVNQIEAIGYEPYMNERIERDLKIYSDFPFVEDYAPFDIVTLFETLEHLDEEELNDFLRRADKLLRRMEEYCFQRQLR
jgi:cyclopropane fatty-acyl-phospholipid synthase-like methyltransferase